MIIVPRASAPANYFVVLLYHHLAEPAQAVLSHSDEIQHSFSHARLIACIKNFDRPSACHDLMWCTHSFISIENRNFLWLGLDFYILQSRGKWAAVQTFGVYNRSKVTKTGL